MRRNEGSTDTGATAQDAAAAELALARHILLRIQLCPIQDIPDVEQCVAHHVDRAEQLLRQA